MRTAWLVVDLCLGYERKAILYPPQSNKNLPEQTSVGGHTLTHTQRQPNALARQHPDQPIGCLSLRSVSLLYLSLSCSVPLSVHSPTTVHLSSVYPTVYPSSVFLLNTQSFHTTVIPYSQNILAHFPPKVGLLNQNIKLVCTVSTVMCLQLQLILKFQSACFCLGNNVFIPVFKISKFYNCHYPLPPFSPEPYIRLHFPSLGSLCTGLTHTHTHNL